MIFLKYFIIACLLAITWIFVVGELIIISNHLDTIAKALTDLVSFEQKKSDPLGFLKDLYSELSTDKEKG